MIAYLTHCVIVRRYGFLLILFFALGALHWQSARSGASRGPAGISRDHRNEQTLQLNIVKISDEEGTLEQQGFEDLSQDSVLQIVPESEMRAPASRVQEIEIEEISSD